jgi:hypothetical protein
MRPSLFWDVTQRNNPEERRSQSRGLLPCSPLPLLSHTLSQINSFHATPYYSWRSILILCSHLRPGLPRGLCHSRLSTKTVYALLSHTYHMLSHLIFIFLVHLNAFIQTANIKWLDDALTQYHCGCVQALMFRTRSNDWRRSLRSFLPFAVRPGTCQDNCLH